MKCEIGIRRPESPGRRILVAVMLALHDVVRYPRIWTSARWKAGGTE